MKLTFRALALRQSVSPSSERMYTTLHILRIRFWCVTPFVTPFGLPLVVREIVTSQFVDFVLFAYYDSYLMTCDKLQQKQSLLLL